MALAQSFGLADAWLFLAGLRNGVQRGRLAGAHLPLEDADALFARHLVDLGEDVRGSMQLQRMPRSKKEAEMLRVRPSTACLS